MNKTPKQIKLYGKYNRKNNYTFKSATEDDIFELSSMYWPNKRNKRKRRRK